MVGDFFRRSPELISYQSRSFFEEGGIIMRTSHVDLYDKPEYVNAAVEKLVGFFNERLGAWARRWTRQSTPM